MIVPARNVKTAVCSGLVLSLLALSGCNKPADAPPQSNAVASSAAAQPAPYTPPSAEQLSQMVAPIALFPDKLVGQVLAGATYPEQITAADQWLAQHPGLKGDALQAAEAEQPWDVSVKSLTTFPSVLNQMTSNPQWTRALGDAYVNDPNDVMNAIQTLRVRAQQAGTLKNSPHLRVATTVVTPPPPSDAPPPDEVAYAGPAVIPPPQQTIIIEPAEPDVVYVPHYNPAVVYGDPVPVYPGWTYRQPAYTSNDLVSTGLLSFGVGVLVGAAVSHHHDSGWNAWGVNWGGPRHDRDGGWHRPAVTYNNNTYISKSVTVVNHVTNNIVNRPQNITINNAPPRPANMPHAAPNFAPHGAPAATPPVAMTMPHFTRHDAVPGSRPPPAAAPAPHMHPPAPAMPPIAQRDPHQPPHIAQQLGQMPPHQDSKPPHVDVRPDRVPAQAMMDRAHTDTMHNRDHAAETRTAAHMPPAQHIEAAPPHAPPPNRQAHSPERQQAQRMPQQMLAMHNERPHGPPPSPAKPPEKRADNSQQHDKHDSRAHHG